MSYKDWYTIRVIVGGFRVLKVDEDYEDRGGYFVSDNQDRLECDCFATHRHTCRHRDMVRMFKGNPEFKAKIEGKWLYNFDKDKWKEPIKVDGYVGSDAVGA